MLQSFFLPIGQNRGIQNVLHLVLSQCIAYHHVSLEHSFRNLHSGMRVLLHLSFWLPDFKCLSPQQSFPLEAKGHVLKLRLSGYLRAHKQWLGRYADLTKCPQWELTAVQTCRKNLSAASGMDSQCIVCTLATTCNITKYKCQTITMFSPPFVIHNHRSFSLVT